MKREDYGEYFTKWDEWVNEYCLLAQVPAKWMKTIMMIESSLGLHPRVKRGLEDPTDIEGSKSEDGKSWGLLQLEPATARDFDMLTSPEKLNDPEYTIRIGSLLLRRLYRCFDGEEEFVIKGWNEGQGAAVLEKAGRIEGKASAYWEKYLAHKELTS